MEINYVSVHAFILGHLLSNMWYLIIFGWILENALGPFVFLALSLFFGAIAVFPEIIFQANPNIPIIGASGSVAFMMGASTSLFPRSRVKLLFMFFPLPNFPNTFFLPLRYLVYGWLGLQLSGLAENVWVHPRPIAYATHLTGFIFGIAVGFLFRLRRKDDLVDIELSGRDLKNFYQSLRNYQNEKTEEANSFLSGLSERKPWMNKLQLQLFKIAVSYHQQLLAAKIWRNLLPGLLMLRRADDAKWALQNYFETFGELPELRIQEKVLITRLLRQHSNGDEKILTQLKVEAKPLAIV